MGKTVVFFLDNEKINVESYVEELKLNEFEVLKYEDIDLAWEYLKGERDIDIVILDIMMPPGKLFTDEEVKLGLQCGIKLLEKIKTLEKRKETPIILLSNLGGDREVNAKVDEYVQKGHRMEYKLKKYCYPSELVELVRKILKLEANHE